MVVDGREQVASIYEDGTLEDIPAANSVYDDVLTVSDGIEEASENLYFHVYVV